MDLFTYLGAKNGKFTLPHKSDLFAYLLGKNSKLPVQTASGTTLEITAKKTNVLELTLDKMCSQDGTPTPNNPIEVNVAEGYRNLLNPEWFIAQSSNYVTLTNTNNKIILDGTATAQADFNTNIKDIPENATKITLSGGTSNVSLAVYFYNNNTYIGYQRDSGSGSIITIPSNANKYAFNIRVANGTELDNYEAKLQLLVSNTILPYVPYGTNYIYTTITGKNLFDKNNVINAFLNSDGTTTTNSTFRVCDYINVSNYEYITISGNSGSSELVCFYDENKNHINANVGMGSSTSKTITIPNDAVYMRATIKATVLDEYQIEVGQSATTYEAYKESIITIPLNNNEVCGIGDYKDVLTIDETGSISLVKNIGKVVLNGEESWVKETQSDNTNFRSTLSSALGGDTSITCLSNYFVGVTGNQSYQGSIDNGIGIGSSKNLRIRSSYFSSYDATAFKNWLSTHNTDVYYILETPTTAPLGSIDISLFKGTNIITNSDNCNMTIKYY